MDNGTDRGYAVISSDDQGTVTVAVCSSLRDGRPADMFARHVGPPKIMIDPAVRVIQDGGLSRTAEIVEVSKGGGPVMIWLASQLRS